MTYTPEALRDTIDQARIESPYVASDGYLSVVAGADHRNAHLDTLTAILDLADEWTAPPYPLPVAGADLLRGCVADALRRMGAL